MKLQVQNPKASLGNSWYHPSVYFVRSTKMLLVCWLRNTSESEAAVSSPVHIQPDHGLSQESQTTLLSHQTHSLSLSLSLPQTHICTHTCTLNLKCANTHPQKTSSLSLSINLICTNISTHIHTHTIKIRSPKMRVWN